MARLNKSEAIQMLKEASIFEFGKTLIL